jgi:acyl-CoA synthetase (AMP-forming)/AMP-acid ligase II
VCTYAAVQLQMFTTKGVVMTLAIYMLLVQLIALDSVGDRLVGLLHDGQPACLPACLCVLLCFRIHGLVGCCHGYNQL